MKSIGLECNQCGKIYMGDTAPRVCGCGNIDGLYGGGFKNVYEEKIDEEGWELVEVDAFDYPDMRVKNATKGTYRYDYGDPDTHRVWLSPDFDGEVVARHRDDLFKEISMY